jgi:predicted metal-dependent HD superfamily phosphohydrolase
VSDRAAFATDLRVLAPWVDAAIVDELWDDLVTRHAEPGRRYHTLRHAALVRHDALGLAEVAGVDDAALPVAAWYHDAVYDRRPGDDEAASANLASWVLRRIDRPDLAARAEELVLTTVDHRPGDDAAAVLVDADLAVLAGTPLDYERYRRRVRAEYGHLADDVWRAGRAAVLRSLLGRDRLFHSPGGRGRERAARRNLLGELARPGGAGV